MRMKFWLAVAAGLAAMVVGAEEISCERFPDADVVTVDEIERVRYNPDGTYEQTDECWTKILTEKGRREESSASLSYSKRYGEARFVYVGAIDADGNEREIDVSATTKESTDNGSLSANIYDPLDRKIVCTIPGLKIGETLHVKTMRRTTKPRCENKWADLSVMEWSHPIIKSTYEVTAPAERPLRRIAIRHPLGNIVTNVARLADGALVHTFTVTNSAQVFPEPDMPPLYTQVQNVRVSTASEWPEISKWYWELCAPHLAKTNAAMVAKVEELTGGARSRMAAQEKINRLFKFVSQEVRYMGLTMEDTSPGYAPHDVDITFDNRYGVCRDKAGLLAAMLRLAGLKAFPVLIHVGAKLDPEVPQPFFNHAIVAVDNAPDGAAADYVLMDPTNESTKDIFPSYLCDKSYLVARPEGETLRTSSVTPPEANAVRAESSGTLMKDGSLFVESEIHFDGINDTAYRRAFVRRKPEERVKFFERVAKAVAPGAELIRCDIEPKDMRDTDAPIVVRLSMKLPEMLLRGETRDELTVPFVTKTLGMVNFLLDGNTALESRKYPLVLDTTAQVREQIKIDLAGVAGEVLELPEVRSDEDVASPTAGRVVQSDEDVASPTAGTRQPQLETLSQQPEKRRPRRFKPENSFNYHRTFAVTNDTLTAERTATIGAAEFSPEAYNELREEIKRMEAAERRRAVFAKDELKDAHVRWLLNLTETTIASDTEWVTTNTVLKEVLTYEGKKNSAEMKFNFNPAVEMFEVVSAVVSNRDGKVSTVSAREMNVMDCGWAAAAPRYPAGKLLVVNLPSVEIGSTIAYTTVRTVTNAPAAFYAEYGFDFHEPVERRVVRVNDWRREVVKPCRIDNEPNQPAAWFWREIEIVSSNRFERMDLKIGAIDSDWLDSNGEATNRSLKSIRDWMAKHVKIAGPGLYALPLACQLTPPETVLKERYATRLDYIRTMCALLRGAGYDADVVFAAADANAPEAERRRIRFERPNVREFAHALCRVRMREGGFLGFGGEEKIVFIGTENQYAPIGPTAYEGCDYFDPERGEFGVVTVPLTQFINCVSEVSEYSVRENGAVDLTVENLTYGSGVGAFRKKYAEILPEERSRLYQTLLGAVSQAATATSELEADYESYPARRKFSCFIPDFATVQGDAITLQIPPLVSSIPSCIGNARRTPFAVAAAERETETVTIRFPEGYTVAESLPKPFIFTNPLNPSEIWLESKVDSTVENNALVVRLTRTVHPHITNYFAPSFYELVKDWSRIADSRANRTVTAKIPAGKR